MIILVKHDNSRAGVLSLKLGSRRLLLSVRPGGHWVNHIGTCVPKDKCVALTKLEKFSMCEKGMI